MNAVNGILWVVMMLLTPTCVGYAVCRWLRLCRDWPNMYLAGCMTQWALIQLLTVPMSLFKGGFIPLVWALSAVLALTAVCGIVYFFMDRKKLRNSNIGGQRPRWNGADVFALILMLVGYAIFVYACAHMQHIDLDDARFVVLAVDIEHTNRLFLTDYGTGQAVADFVSTLRHDIFSPWAVNIAYIARMTDTPVAVVAHTALPQALMLCMCCVYWNVSGRFFPNRRFERFGMVLLGLLISVYSGSATMAAEAYFLRRSWQGKATVAGIGIPTLYLALTAVWNASEEWRSYLLMYMVVLAMCCMSAMGIILATMLCGAFGLAYGIRKRSVPVALKTWGGAFICLSYVGVMLLRIM